MKGVTAVVVFAKGSCVGVGRRVLGEDILQDVSTACSLVLFLARKTDQLAEWLQRILVS